MLLKDSKTTMTSKGYTKSEKKRTKTTIAVLSGERVSMWAVTAHINPFTAKHEVVLIPFY